MLASSRCKAIVAISEYGKRQFIRQHSKFPWFDEVCEKLSVRYPNIPLGHVPDGVKRTETTAVRLVFVGNHFARKGGTVALRMAELAAGSDLPILLDVVSSLEVGPSSWVDPTRPGYFDEDFELLNRLPNVRHYGGLPNDQVLGLVEQAHFVLLPTFSDTFGFSTIEAMARCTPVIATSQGALPEFVADGINGILLPLDTDDVGEWKHIGSPERGRRSYERLFEGEVERLAEEALHAVKRVMASPGLYDSMRKNARNTAERLFDARDASRFWDDLYCESVRR
jgi:glycosyltransferase involved in cell wall biosynthesis